MHGLLMLHPEDAPNILDEVYSHLKTDPEREFSLLLLIYGTQELRPYPFSACPAGPYLRCALSL